MPQISATAIQQKMKWKTSSSFSFIQCLFWTFYAFDKIQLCSISSAFASNISFFIMQIKFALHFNVLSFLWCNFDCVVKMLHYVGYEQSITFPCWRDEKICNHANYVPYGSRACKQQDSLTFKICLYIHRFSGIKLLSRLNNKVWKSLAFPCKIEHFWVNIWNVFFLCADACV